MASGFGFIGNQKIGDLSITEQVVHNTSNWINISFLENGGHRKVVMNETNTTGIDLSEFKPVEDYKYDDGYVYQSNFKNLVHESGIVHNDSFEDPIICSGIYVGGDYYPKEESGVMSYHIDYTNGRVIFDNYNVIEDVYGSGDISVYAEFSYKTVTVMTSDEARKKAVQTESKNNPAGSGDYLPEENHIQLPAVVVNSIEDTWLPYELGGHKKARHSVAATVYGSEKNEVSKIVDILSQQQNKKIPSIDWNKSSSQLDEFGDINPEFSGVYVSKEIYPWKHLYILTARGSKEGRGNMSGTVSFLIESIYHM